MDTACKPPKTPLSNVSKWKVCWQVMSMFLRSEREEKKLGSSSGSWEPVGHLPRMLELQLLSVLYSAHNSDSEEEGSDASSRAGHVINPCPLLLSATLATLCSGQLFIEPEPSGGGVQWTAVQKSVDRGEFDVHFEVMGRHSRDATPRPRQDLGSPPCLLPSSPRATSHVKPVPSVPSARSSLLQCVQAPTYRWCFKRWEEGSLPRRNRSVVSKEGRTGRCSVARPHRRPSQRILKGIHDLSIGED